MSRTIKRLNWGVYNSRMKEIFTSSIRPTRKGVLKAIGCEKSKDWKGLSKVSGYRLIKIVMIYSV